MHQLTPPATEYRLCACCTTQYSSVVIYTSLAGNALLAVQSTSMDELTHSAIFVYVCMYVSV